MMRVDNDVLAFASSPITITFLVLTVISLAWPIWQRHKARKQATA
jgi:TctA family transporter